MATQVTSTSSEKTSVDERSLPDYYRDVRGFTEQLCRPLTTEDFVVQSMPDVSPTKWHLAHTTWFFETFVLADDENYQPFHPQYHHLFNSYYNTVGTPWHRPSRGLLSRPTVAEVFAYRAEIDRRMDLLLRSDRVDRRLGDIVVLGLHHEQQHQELVLMDIKHVFSCNPLDPVYQPRTQQEPGGGRSAQWLDFEGGFYSIGHGGEGFCYDNETPRHERHVRPFRMADRPVTNRQYQEFIEDGGYRRCDLWLSDGWTTVQENGWDSPLYWRREDDSGRWRIFTLSGLRELDPDEPVCHLSYYEADAYARWADARLPGEFEWEIAARHEPRAGNLVEAGRYHPAAAQGDGRQFFGDVWEWTADAYHPYPGYRPSAGALGEYNAKFMCNQYVLRGGSCVTSADHIRPTYRNFFHPHCRWPFTGLRLARDIT